MYVHLCFPSRSPSVRPRAPENVALVSRLRFCPLEKDLQGIVYILHALGFEIKNTLCVCVRARELHHGKLDLDSRRMLEYKSLCFLACFEGYCA